MRAPEPRHGETSEIARDGLGVFSGLSNPFVATRCRSLATIDLPDELVVTAHGAEDGVVQGVPAPHPPDSHGVQFHPEHHRPLRGWRLLKNFLQG